MLPLFIELRGSERRSGSEFIYDAEVPREKGFDEIYKVTPNLYKHTKHMFA